MRKILSLIAILAVMTACGTTKQEETVTEPVETEVVAPAETETVPADANGGGAAATEEVVEATETEAVK